MKKRVVQIDTLYPQFSLFLEKEVERLNLTAYADVIRLLLSSGYNHGHNVVPYLNKQDYDTYLLFAGSPAVIQSLAKELGLIGKDLNELLFQIVGKLQPHFVYISDLTTIDFSAYRSLKSRPKLIGWHATSVSEAIKFEHLDLLLSGISGIRDYAASRGCLTEKYYPAANARPGFHDLRAYQVTFVGSNFGGLHARRTNLLFLVANALPTVHFDFFIHYSGKDIPENVTIHEPVFGNEMLDVYSNSSIVLDIRADFNVDAGSSRRETSNMRLLEATAEGALVVTENSSNLLDLFEPEIEIVTFGDFDELVSKVRFYSDPSNEDSAKTIARKGRRKARESHSIARRAEQFSKFLTDFEIKDASLAQPLTRQTRIVVFMFICGEDHLFSSKNIEKLVLRQDVYLILFVNYKYLGALTKNQFFRKFFSSENVRIVPMLTASFRCLFDAMAGSEDIRQAISSHEKLLYISGRIDFSLEDLDGTGTHLLAEFNRNSTAESIFTQGFVHFLKMNLEPINGTPLTYESFFELFKKIFTQQVYRCFDGIKDGVSSKLLPRLSLHDNETWLIDFSSVRSSMGAKEDEVRVYLAELTELNNSALSDLQSKIQSNVSSDHVECSRQEFFRNNVAGPISTSESSMIAGPVSQDIEVSGSWNSASLIETQHQSFQSLLAAAREGRARVDLKVLYEFLGDICHEFGGRLSLLEIGCGSGYLSEVAAEVSSQLDYSGLDSSSGMISKAKECYPQLNFNIGSDQNLDFSENSFDIVLSGASLMHSEDASVHVLEATRVARKYVLIHTVTTADLGSSLRFTKQGYGQPLQETVFSNTELGLIIEHSGLIPLEKRRLFDYVIEKEIGVDLNVWSIKCIKMDEGDLSEGRYNFYYTYFDSNYLTKGLGMIASLQSHDPNAYVFVACMDQAVDNFFRNEIESCEMVVQFKRDRIRPISIDEITRADSKFIATRATRSQVEWYFTATSCIANFLINLVPQGDRLTYLDADLFFYSNPQVLLREARDSAVQVIPHRFSNRWKGLDIYGIYNVGWISFENSDEGRKVISSYREKCLDWCYDRIEDGKFADQKYLDTWPADFDRVCISGYRGANVGWWNIGEARASSLGNFKFIDDDIVIFVHASGISKSEHGYYLKHNYLDYGGFYFAMYQPYIEHLNAIQQSLESYGFLDDVRDIRYMTY